MLGKSFNRAFLIITILSIVIFPIFAGEDYIKVIKDGVNIRFENDPNSTIIAKANKGDIFEFKSEKGDWYEINMFSGEYRYIYKSLASIVSYNPGLPQLSIAKAMFSSIGEAEDKSMLDAEKKYPITQDMDKNIDYTRILEDRYKLEIFHRYNTPPAAYMKILTEGIKRGWK